MNFNKILESYSKELITELYINQKLSIETIAKQLNICVNSVSKLIKYYNLYRDTSRIQADKIHKIGIQKFNSTLEKIPKNLFQELYIDKNLPRKYFMDTYNLTSYTLDKIINYYDIHKPKKQSIKLSIETKQTIYPSDNFNNWQKGQLTRIKNSGSIIESYKQGLIKNQETCLKRYGYKSLLSSPYLASHRKKSDTHPNNSFANLLDRNQITYEREFVLDTKSYDFKVNNVLIEIDPYITHNIN